MSGRIGDLNPKQEKGLQQFKENLKDVLEPHHDDHYLLRWLRARKFDLKKSEKMLRDSLAWRKEKEVDTMVEKWTPPEVTTKFHPGGIVGVDKQGRPIWLENIGYLDFKGLFHSAKASDIIKYRIWETERVVKKMEEQSKKLGRRVDESGILIDMDKITMKFLWKPGLECGRDLLIDLEANYPEMLAFAYIVNAPKIFPFIYNLAKPFLSEDTKSKIKILGGNWKEELLKYIDADQLPKHWGGSNEGEDGDPYCKHLVNMGGDIPESYHIQKSNFVDMSKYTTITVGRGAAEQVEVEVKEKGCILTWNFWTDDKDIGFGVYRKTSSEKQALADMEEVQKTQRVNSHMVPEDGRMACFIPGIYVLNFDNTYSWVNSKKVSYETDLLPPDTLAELMKSESFVLDSTDL